MITTTNNLESLDKSEPRLASRMKDTSRCRFFGIIVPSFRGGQAQQAAKRGRPKVRS